MWVLMAYSPSHNHNFAIRNALKSSLDPFYAEVDGLYKHDKFLANIFQVQLLDLCLTFMYTCKIWLLFASVYLGTEAPLLPDVL